MSQMVSVMGGDHPIVLHTPIEEPRLSLRHAEQLHAELGKAIEEVKKRNEVPVAPVCPDCHNPMTKSTGGEWECLSTHFDRML